MNRLLVEQLVGLPEQSLRDIQADVTCDSEDKNENALHWLPFRVADLYILYWMSVLKIRVLSRMRHIWLLCIRDHTSIEATVLTVLRQHDLQLFS
jgi:hypothetical protein